MTTVSRLAGAILVEDSGCFYLVGDSKEPLNYKEYGFQDTWEGQPLKDRDPVKQVVVPLLILATETQGGITGDFPKPKLQMIAKGEGAAVALRLAQALVIRRNGSVSERLWNLVLESSGERDGLVDIQWLCDTPEPIWDIVRDQVLRCS